MAKKTTLKQNTATNTESRFKRFKSFFTNERTTFIIGLIISFLTIYIGLALISFFFTGASVFSTVVSNVSSCASKAALSNNSVICAF